MFIFANSADPNKMPHYVAFYWSLHCLPKYLFRGIKHVELIHINICAVGTLRDVFNARKTYAFNIGN